MTGRNGSWTRSRVQTWPSILRSLASLHGQPARSPLPLGNHADPNDEAVFIQLTYMTRSQRTVEAAFDDLRALAPTSWTELADADPRRVADAVRPLGLITRRTENLMSFGAQMADRHGGDLMTLDDLADADLLKELMALPGLGPKGARCVAAYSFGRDVMAVDVHVLRVAKRLGMLEPSMTWARATRLIEEGVPAGLRYDAHVLLVQHGREVCTQRAPACHACPLVGRCPSAFIASDRRADYVPELRHGTNGKGGN
ncbi:Endonuclease III [Euzebya pacifica]|uniref:Endonuclease III n=1 Tax=Euzebya pacifica TaxID=1608957 RepID=A0A346XS59_9ACTN|nr:hypothetical protein [Euzebya pacifica]AXV05056.1 Endonuclease III [Euzebya pacifica]